MIETETHTTGNLLTMASSDSDEEYSQVEQPITPWNDLSIVERVGLNTMQMSEEEVESAFCQITLAFRTDQYTLKQRLQAEEHARNLAEENVQQELSRGKETLETLKGLCLDMRRRAILQRLELSLDILGGTVERISNTAEVLGSVHQEARICRAVEIMVAHVENLKRRHGREGAELEQTKKLVHRISRRNLSEQGATADANEMELQNQDKKFFQHYHGRRRVSTSIITKESQEKRKRELKKQASQGDARCPSPTCSSESSCSVMTRDDMFSLGGRLLVDADTPLDPSPVPDPESPPPPPPPPPPPSEEEAAKKTSKSFPLDTLRQRPRGKAALSKRKAAREKKGVHRFRSSLCLQSTTTWRGFPLTCWLLRSRWAVLYVALLMILCAAIQTLFS